MPATARIAVCAILYALALLIGSAGPAVPATVPAPAALSALDRAGAVGSGIDFDDTTIDTTGVDDRR